MNQQTANEQTGKVLGVLRKEGIDPMDREASLASISEMSLPSKLSALYLEWLSRNAQR